MCIKNQSLFIKKQKPSTGAFDKFAIMKRYAIAVDLGATSGRVILSSVETDGVCGKEPISRIGMETLHRFPTKLLSVDGKYYWDLYDIHDNIREGLKIASSRDLKIESIGIDTWGVDFVGIKEDGTISSLPRSYRDPYSFEAMDEFLKLMPREQIYSHTGIQLMNFNSVFQLYAQNKAGELKDVDKILFIPDALSYMLTGRMVCEYTILSTSALMDPATKDFSEPVLKVCGLDRSKFAQIVLPGTQVGVLKDEYGLGPVPVLAVAGHDTASAVYAVPADADDFAYLSSGTWSLMGIETPHPVINGQMAALNYTNEGGAKGNIRLLKNITGMWLLEQCLAKWRSEGKDYSYPQLMQMAADSSCSADLPRSKVLIDPDDKLFASPIDMPSAIRSRYAQLVGEADVDSRGSASNELTDAQLVRLIFDSLAAKYAEVFHNLESIAGRKLSQLNIIGGGCQNELLSQMTADACGVKVVAGPAECTALGNVMIQLGLGRKDILKSIETKTFYPNE